MPTFEPAAFRRPYLVIPKLVEQPTWGGTYIVESKGWADRPGLADLKIGQAYELYSLSNLSLLSDSADPQFEGELADRDEVAEQTRPPHSLALSDLIAADAEAVLGSQVVASRGPRLDMLLKYTQALGNSFQTHIKAGLKHPKWLPKPEAWYYFEPGVITLGVKPGTNWADYEAALRGVADGMSDISAKMKAGKLDYAAAQDQARSLLERLDPWQYVNELRAKAGDMVDLTSGALHHSWEEDATAAPLGNVLFEIQSEALDAVSTFRGFDKGKIGRDGTVRPVHLDEYFEFIDRTPEANDPQTHLVAPRQLEETNGAVRTQLLATNFYNLERLDLPDPATTYSGTTDHFRHFFAKTGAFKLTSGGQSVTVRAGHSAFLPAGAGEYTVENLAPVTEIIISY